MDSILRKLTKFRYFDRRKRSVQYNEKFWMTFFCSFIFHSQTFSKKKKWKTKGNKTRSRREGRDRRERERREKREERSLSPLPQFVGEYRSAASSWKRNHLGRFVNEPAFTLSKSVGRGAQLEIPGSREDGCYMEP